MSALPQPRDLLTAAEYLRNERIASSKSEYVNGCVYAMAGATVNHNRVAGNAYHRIRTLLAKRQCEVFNSDLKVRIDKANVFRYPDLSGLCGPMVFHDETEDAYTNPSIIIEVLSPSTAKLDRGEKFNLYRLLDTLVEYVLVDPEKYWVEVFRRDSGNRWSSVIYTEAADSFHLRSLDVNLQLSEIYERVVFSE
jgi:Uma2 family endonuclease